MAMKENSKFPNLRNWSLTTRLFHVISGIWGCLTSLQRCSKGILQAEQIGLKSDVFGLLWFIQLISNCDGLLKANKCFSIILRFSSKVKWYVSQEPFCNLGSDSWRFLFLVEWGTMLFTVFYCGLPWLPHALPGSLFINSLYAHVVLERSTDREWRNLPNFWWSGMFVGAICQDAGYLKTTETLY